MKWIASVISGLLLSLCFPPASLGWLAWLALVPVFWAALESRDAHEAANMGAVCGLIFFALGFSWFKIIFGPWVPYAFACVFALWIALQACLLRAFRDRVGPGALVALGAFLWVGHEYFRSEVWKLANAFLVLGYSQAPHLTLLQSASLWGVYGISALIVAINLALLMALRGQRRPLLVVCAIVVASLAWGSYRLKQPLQGREIRVAVVQNETRDMESMARDSLQAEAKNADLLVWPEYGILIPKGQDEVYRRQLAAYLKGTKAVAVTAAYRYPDDLKGKPEDWRNFAWVISPAGKILGDYDKQHPIPFVEALLPAHKNPVAVDTSLGRIGVQICYDFDFENGARRLAAQGAEILAVPNSDPLEWGLKQHLQHSAMPPLRAIETGLWVARAASSGVSQIIDSRGRVVASLETGKRGAVTGQARLNAARTPYVVTGWLLGPASLGLLFLSCIYLVYEYGIKRRKLGI